MNKPQPENVDGDGGIEQVRQAWHTPLRGWLTILHRVHLKILHDHVFLSSAGIAFLAILALFPTFSALLSFYGLITSPAQLQQQIQTLRFVVPPELIQLLIDNLRALTLQNNGALGLSFIISTILAIWVATRAVMGAIGALNIVYGENENRPFHRLVAIATTLAIGSLLFWVGTLLVIVGVPVILSQMGIETRLVRSGILALRWLLIAVAALVSMTVAYFFCPSHRHPRWRWLSVGSIVATLLWLAGSAILSWYTRHVGNFSTIYGQLGVVVLLQLWFFFTSFAFLIGAEINVEMERWLHSRAGRGT